VWHWRPTSVTSVTTARESVYSGASICGKRVLTSTVISSLYPDIIKTYASLDHVYLLRPTGERQAQPVAVKEGDHVLSTHTFFSLPADMQGATKSDVTERTDLRLGHRIRDLVTVRLSLLICGG